MVTVNGYDDGNGHENGNGNGYGNGDGQQGSNRTANNGVTETRITITEETDGLRPGSTNAPYGVRVVGEASQAEVVSLLSEIAKVYPFALFEITRY